VIFDEPLAGESDAVRQGFMVLMPGDMVRVFTQDAPATYWLSGAELEGLAD